MHDGALDADMYGVNTIGKVFMSYKYPESHPIQTMRAKKNEDVPILTHPRFRKCLQDYRSPHSRHTSTSHLTQIGH